LPTAQFVQADAPVLAANVPKAHDEHEVAPVSPENFPSVQLSQAVLADCPDRVEKRPAAQLAHKVEPEAKR